MTELERHLVDLIRAQGPISIAEFMRIAISGRPESYYLSAAPFGADGDFITAPEISQVFGELIGLWCVDMWQQLGSPPRFTLAELGPGRGTLMKDALRAARVSPAFVAAASVALVEVSPVLRTVQRETLSESGASSVSWFGGFEDIPPNGPAIVVANEFFDALPIRQFIRGPRAWSERCVGLDAKEQLSFGASPEAIDARLIPATLREAPAGTIVEISPARRAVATTIAERVAATTGALLAVDYGYEGPQSGDTLQAVKKHAPAPVLADVGRADITAHVDFKDLALGFVEGGTRAVRPVTQGAFLNALGAQQRTRMLARGASVEQARRLESGTRRLTDADAMGSLFKVIAAVAPPTLQPAGL